VSFYFPPDTVLQQRAKIKLRKLFLKQSFIERWELVANEMKWVISGRPKMEEHEKILPDYCYGIFDLYKRTIFKAFPTLDETLICTDRRRLAECKTTEEAKQFITIKWENLGSVCSIGERVAMFYENQAEAELDKAGLLNMKPKKDKEFYELMIGDRWMGKKLQNS
jgi:hypothetical protein